MSAPSTFSDLHGLDPVVLSLRDLSSLFTRHAMPRYGLRHDDSGCQMWSREGLAGPNVLGDLAPSASGL